MRVPSHFRRLLLSFVLVSIVSGSTTPTLVSGLTDDCIGASVWFKGTMSRFLAQSRHMETFVADSQQWRQMDTVPVIDGAKYLMISAEITKLQAEQLSSAPSTAANEVNDMIVERFDHLASAFVYLSQVESEEDSSLIEQASGEIHAARLLAEQIVPQLGGFIDICDLATDASVQQELDCYNVTVAKNSDWYKNLAGTIIDVMAVDAEVVDAIESSDVSQANRIADDLRAAAADLDKYTPPGIGRALHVATREHIESIAAMIDAAVSGSDAEIDKAISEYDVATARIEAAESAFLESCLVLDQS